MVNTYINNIPYNNVIVNHPINNNMNITHIPFTLSTNNNANIGVIIGNNTTHIQNINHNEMVNKHNSSSFINPTKVIKSEKSDEIIDNISSQSSISANSHITTSTDNSHIVSTVTRCSPKSISTANDANDMDHNTMNTDKHTKHKQSFNLITNNKFQVPQSDQHKIKKVSKDHVSQQPDINIMGDHVCNYCHKSLRNILYSLLFLALFWSNPKYTL